MSLWQDVRLAARVLLRDRWYTAVAVLALGLGISLNTTVFTLVNAVLLRGLPYENGDRIMVVEWLQPTDTDGSTPVSWPDYQDWVARQRSFSALAAHRSFPANLSDDAQAPERVQGARLTANAFALLGQPTLIGRNFTADEDQPGAEPVVILGYGVWQTRYGGAADILGRVIRINEVPTEVVGVMPKDMKFPQNADLWIPLVPTQAERERTHRRLIVFGRLKDEITLAQAQDDMSRIAAALEKEHPDANRQHAARVIGYSDRVSGGEIRLVFLMLMGAVGFVLLIACANVANLLLSRSATRAREMAVRISLGATRWRIVRQLLIESVMLGALSGLFGLWLAYFGVQAFDRAVSDVGKPYWMVFTMDPAVFVFLAAVCIVTGVLFGLAPALHVSRANVNELLKEGGRSGGAGVRARRFGTVMVAVEVALTVVLLGGAALMLRSFLNIQSLQHPFETKNLMTGSIGLFPQKYPDAESRIRLYDAVLSRAQGVPGITAVTMATAAPMSGTPRPRLEIDGTPEAEPERAPRVGLLQIADNYFDAMGVALRRGRPFRGDDGRAGNDVAIVNERFVAQHFSDGDAVGRRIRLRTDPRSQPGPWLTIVGVSPLIRQAGSSADLNDDRSTPIVYTPLRQDAPDTVVLLARTAGATGAAAGLREAVQAVDRDLPLANLRTFDETMARNTWPWRVFGSMFAIFAVVALVLSGIGIYAVTAYSVAQRTQEIGVRMALGAEKRQVSWLILRGGLLQLAAGAVVGLAGAVGVGELMKGLLVRVSGTDPVTLGAIVTLLAVVITAACLVPAARAMRVDPVIALRNE